MIRLEYLIPIYLILIGIFLETLFIKKKSIQLHYYFFLVVIYMIMLAGSRYQLGPDWIAYEHLFFYIKNNIGTKLNFLEVSKGYGQEIGFVFVNYLANVFNLSYWQFNLIFAGISIFLKTNTILRYSKFIFIGLFMYYIPLLMFEDMIQIRQGFATGLTIFSIRYIIKKERVKFLICVLLAFQFHKSSIIFLPAYWIGNTNLSFKYFNFITIFMIVTYPIGISKYFNFIFKNLPISSVSDGFNSYSETGYAVNMGFTFGDLVKISYYILILFFNKICITTDKEGIYKIIRNLYLTSIILFFFFHDQAIFAVRLPGYYAATAYLLIPLILYQVKLYSKNIFLVLFVIFMIYQVLFLYRNFDLHERFLSIYNNYLYETK